MKLEKNLNHGLKIGAAYLRSNAAAPNAQAILDVQLARIQQCAVEDGVELARVYTSLVSGLSNVEKIEIVLAAAQAGKFSVLYVDRLDRLSRNLSETIGVATRLSKYGVVIRSVSENMDTSVPNGKLMLHLLELISGLWENLPGKEV